MRDGTVELTLRCELPNQWNLVMEDGRKMDWNVIFDGIGSQIVGVLVGALVTSAISIPISYNAGKRSVAQKQKAGNNAVQTQVSVSNER